MTIGEANDTNTVLRYLLGLPNAIGEIPPADQVQKAAERLADKAHKVLMAGITGDQVNGMRHQLKAWG